MKFCNQLRIDNGTELGMPITLELQVADVTVRAASGECAPLPGMACTGVAAGDLSFTVRFPAQGNEILFEDTVSMTGGTSYVFVANLPENETEPALNIVERTASQCQAYTAADFP